MLVVVVEDSGLLLSELAVVEIFSGFNYSFKLLIKCLLNAINLL